jgi:hypothetical protein
MDKELIALKEFPYNGKQRKKGERFTASARAARIFIGVGKAKEAGPKRSRKTEETDLLAAGEYGRRDMRVTG